MSRLIDIGLERLSNILYKMGDLAKETVSLSFDCYTKKVEDHAKVQLGSQNLVFLSETIEDQAVELIARYQPVASDLRTIKSYMKIAYDYSRCGRYAWDITFTHKRLNIDLADCKLPELPLDEMSEKVLEMVDKSVEAVRKHDIDLAQTLSKMEQEIDDMYIKSLDKLTEPLPISAKCVVANLLFVRHLERIADHASYIGEAVIYIVTGERVILR